MKTRSYNDILLAAVESDNIDEAKDALANGANPDFNKSDIDGAETNNTPLIFLVTSPEMMKLLLKHGVNPNQKRWTEFSTFEYQCISSYLLTQLIGSNKIDLLATLANYQPCTIDNNHINGALIKLFSKYAVNLYADDFDWKSREGSVIATLIRISTDLREVVKEDDGCIIDNPLSLALRNNLTCVIVKMLNHNIWLWEDLKSNHISYDITITYKNKSKKFDELVNEIEIAQFFKILNLWLLLMPGIENKSNLSILPLDLLVTITQMAVMSCNFDLGQLQHWQDYLKQNSELKTQMIAFGKIYSILRNNKLISIDNEFWENNKNLKPFRFFSIAHQQTSAHPKGLTSATLNLIDKHKADLSRDNENLVSGMTEYCTKDTISFFTNEKITENIKTELGIKLANK